MESLEYYKLKDELTELLRADIEKNISRERDLQQRYVGLGLKVALGGLGAAVVAVGLFGIKSLYDVNTAIKTIPNRIADRVNEEVTKRFNSSNPVVQYETMLRESAARALAAAIQLQSKRSAVSLDESMSSAIVEALTSDGVQQGAKLALIRSLSTQKVRTVRPAIDQAVLVIVKALASAKPVDERSLVQCLDYFSYRSPARFVADVERIYEPNQGLPGVRQAIARYLSKIDKQYGDDLAKMLNKADDLHVKLVLHLRNLKGGKDKRLDSGLFKMLLDHAFNGNGDGPEIEEIVDLISIMHELDNVPSEVFRDFLNVFRTEARANGLTFAAGNLLDREDSFFGLAGPSRKRVNIERSQFDTLYNLAIDDMIERIGMKSAIIDDSVVEALDFWLPKARDGNSVVDKRVGFLIVSPSEGMKFTFEDGTSAGIETQGILTVRTSANKLKLILRKHGDDAQSAGRPIVGIDNPSGLRGFGSWRRFPTEDDAL